MDINGNLYTDPEKKEKNPHEAEKDEILTSLKEFAKGYSMNKIEEFFRDKNFANDEDCKKLKAIRGLSVRSYGTGLVPDEPGVENMVAKYAISRRYEDFHSTIEKRIKNTYNQCSEIPTTEEGIKKAKEIIKQLVKDIKEEIAKKSELMLKEAVYINNNTAKKIKKSIVEKLKRDYPKLGEIWNRETLENHEEDRMIAAINHDAELLVFAELDKVNEDDTYLNSAPGVRHVGIQSGFELQEMEWAVNMTDVANWKAYDAIYLALINKHKDYLSKFERIEEESQFTDIALDFKYDKTNKTIIINASDRERKLTQAEKQKLFKLQGTFLEIMSKVPNSQATYLMDGANFKNETPVNFWGEALKQKFKEIFPGNYPIRVEKTANFEELMQEKDFFNSYGIISRASFDGNFEYNKDLANKRAKEAEKSLKQQNYKIIKNKEFDSFVVGISENGEPFNCKNEADINKSWENLLGLYKSQIDESLKSVSDLKKLVNKYNSGHFDKYLKDSSGQMSQKDNPDKNPKNVNFFDKYLAQNRSVTIVHQESKTDLKIKIEE